MSGIFGCYYFAKPSLELGSIGGAMQRPLEMDEASQKDVCIVDGHIVLGTVRTTVDASPYIEKIDADQSIVLFNGFLGNKEELSREAGLKNDACNEGKILSKLLERYGYESFSELSGVFSFAIYDRRTGQFSIGADRCGFEYLYYYIDDEKFLFGSRVKSIANLIQSQLSFDLHSICDIHNYQSIFNQRTIFNEIKLLPPANVCMVRNRKYEIRQFWQFPVRIECMEKSEPDLLDISRKLIQKSVKQCISDIDNPGVMLSGGLDSRLLAGVLSSEVRNAKALSLQWAPQKSDENKLAKKIAEALELDFYYFKADTTEIVDFIEKNIDLSDGAWGFYDLVPFFENIRKRFPTVTVLNGFLMDTLFRSAWAFFPNREDERLSSERILSRYTLLRDYQTDMVFTDDFNELLKTKRKETVKNTIGNHPLDKPAEVSLLFYIHNRGRRTILSQFNILRQFVPIRFPGVLNEVFDFAIRLPYHVRSDTEFYRKLICEWFPEIGRIPWDRTGKPLNLEPGRFEQRYGRLRQKMGYLLQRASRGRLDFFKEAFVFDKRFRQNKNFRNAILDILYDNRSLSRGYFARGGVEKLIKHELSGRDFGHVFKSILSVEMMHRSMEP